MPSQKGSQKVDYCYCMPKFNEAKGQLVESC